MKSGVRTGASTRNWASYGSSVHLPAGLEDWRKDTLTDPQTSGGLLIAVAPAHADEVLALAHQRGFDAARKVGAMVEGAAEIRVR